MTAVIGFALTFLLKPLAYVVAVMVALGLVVCTAILAHVLGGECYRLLARHYGRLNRWSEGLASAWHGRYLEVKSEMLFDTEKTATKVLRATGWFLLMAVAAAVLAPGYMLSDMIWKSLAEDQYLLTITPALLGSALLVVARPALHFAWTLMMLDKDEWFYARLVEREQTRLKTEFPNAERFKWQQGFDVERLRDAVAQNRQARYLAAMRDLSRV